MGERWFDYLFVHATRWHDYLFVGEGQPTNLEEKPASCAGAQVIPFPSKVAAAEVEKSFPAASLATENEAEQSAATAS